MDIKLIREMLLTLTGLDHLNINRFSAVNGDEVFFKLEGIEQTRNLYTATVTFLSKASTPALAELPLLRVIENVNHTNLFFNDNQYQLVYARGAQFTPEFEGDLESGEFLYSTSVEIKIFKLEEELDD